MCKHDRKVELNNVLIVEAKKQGKTIRDLCADAGVMYTVDIGLGNVLDLKKCDYDKLLHCAGIDDYAVFSPSVADKLGKGSPTTRLDFMI